MRLSKEYPTVLSVAKEPNMGPLPRLIDDARASEPVFSSDEGQVYIRIPTAFPYTTIHGLIIPDLNSKQDAPGVLDIPQRLLAETFDITGRFASQVISQTEAESIDIGWNYSPAESVKRIASQQKNLHIHVIGYNPGELQTISGEQVKQDAYSRSKLAEKADPISTSILQTQVIPFVPKFNDFFEPVPNSPMTFKLQGELKEIADPRFAKMIQDLHQTSLGQYEKLISCFVKDQEFDKFGRPIPETSGKRFANLSVYLARNPEISAAASRRLRALASMVVPFEELVSQQLGTRDTLDDQVKDLLYSEGALNGFAYSMNFSGQIDKDRQVKEWFFRFHPVVFSSQDLLQASTDFKLFQRDETKHLTAQQLAQAQLLESTFRSSIQ